MQGVGSTKTTKKTQQLKINPTHIDIKPCTKKIIQNVHFISKLRDNNAPTAEHEFLVHEEFGMTHGRYLKARGTVPDCPGESKASEIAMVAPAVVYDMAICFEI